MLEVSERAREALKQALDANTSDPEQGLRLTITGADQLGLGVDVERPGDQVYEHEGAKVLIVDSNMAEMVSEMSLDIGEKEDGLRLMMVGSVAGDGSQDG